MHHLFLSVLVIICTLISAKDAFSINLDAHYGTTNISIPSTLLTVRVDNAGNVTGTGSQVKVSHTDPGDWCHKVNKVEANLYAKSCSGLGGWCWWGPPDKNFHLCNFNVNDATFNFTFPAVFPGQESIVKDAWINNCKASGTNGGQLTTQHPFFKRLADLTQANLFIRLSYANGDQETIKYQVPPVILNCDPCPQISVKDSMKLQPDAMANVLATSVVTGGGIAPYTVSFSRLPTGLFQQGAYLSGRPAKGIYTGTVTVRDNCRSANNQVTKSFRFDVVDAIAPTVSNASATPNAISRTGGPVVVRVTATDNSTVTYIKAKISGPGGTQNLPLTMSSGTVKNGVWQGTFNAPANTSSQNASYSVNFEVADDGGNVVTLAGPGFVVNGKDTVVPLIQSYTVNPMTFTYQGGTITVTVKATDDEGIQQVRIIYIKPNGQQTAIPSIPRVSGTAKNGEWRQSWEMPYNTTSMPQVYGIRAEVFDSANKATTQTVSVTIPVKPAGPVMPKKPAGPIRPGYPQL